jgi:hypothetical protein
MSAKKLVPMILLGIGLGIAAAFVWRTLDSASLEGFYVITDTITYANDDAATTILYVQVESADSAKIVRTTRELAERTLTSDTSTAKRRVIELRCYVPSDTQALTQEMVDELAYTNPSIEDPQSTLYVVPNGVLARVWSTQRPAVVDSVDMIRTLFYRPRGGSHVAP